MKVEIFFSKHKSTEKKMKKTGTKSQIISIYGKATKKENLGRMLFKGCFGKKLENSNISYMNGDRS